MAVQQGPGTHSGPAHQFLADAVTGQLDHLVLFSWDDL